MGSGQFEIALKGHEFTRAVKTAKQTWALAPEGVFEITPSSLYAPGFRLPEEMQKRLRVETNGDILVRNREAKWGSGPPFSSICIVTQNPGTVPSFVWEWSWLRWQRSPAFALLPKRRQEEVPMRQRRRAQAEALILRNSEGLKSQ